MMNKLIKLGVLTIVLISNYAMPTLAATRSLETQTIGRTDLQVKPGVKIINATSADFGNWTLAKLGKTIYNVDTVHLRIQDERDNDSGDWSILVKSDKVVGAQGQTCDLADYVIDGAKASITRQMSDGQFQSIDKKVIRTSDYQAHRDQHDWTPIVATHGATPGPAKYQITWDPGAIGIKLCRNLQPDSYAIVTHWLVTDGIT
ncbi:hypothetical protein EQG49_05160 [Periweissella cryptocerci]|uniref:Uncharacterized protein n=1 Tax=Periweissella cryptocerci TaxID=2506420 RepID=A0A4P6YT17_9LACO|nr:hypothetical protein [Periweissella cryptocerci]QBO35888.1 hypothetical protein EQG49_05160 [Periweissella cryptocerci]